MAKKRTRSATRGAPARRDKALPQALVGRARALAATKQKRPLAAGGAALARINQRNAEITGTFWDIGDELLVLRESAMARERATADRLRRPSATPASTPRSTWSRRVPASRRIGAMLAKMSR